MKILDLVGKKTNTNMADFTADDLFYLSISRNAQQLNTLSKVRLQQKVLNALVEEMTEQSDVLNI